MNGDQKRELLADAQVIHTYSLRLEALARTLKHVKAADDEGKSSLKSDDLIHIMSIFESDLDAIRDIARGIVFTLERDGDPVHLAVATCN